MTPQEAIDYIERYTWSKTRLGLERTRALLHGLGDPQKELRFIHVAGSNGKGSTCAMLDAILRRAGYRVGLYTSPYLEEFRERMQVNGQYIPEERLAAITARTAAVADAMEDHPSQFELVTAIGMLWFLEERCDIVLLEVGMGGDLDSTNVIDPPELAVITNIGLDHTEYLGHTLTEIAAAKAGILKSGCDCVLYDGPPEAEAVVRAVCAEKNIPLRKADSSEIVPVSSDLEGQRFTYRGAAYELSLLGRHQLRNAAVVLEAVEALRDRGWTVPSEAVTAGLRETRWPARLEVLSRRPLFLLDGGHNPQCAEALAEALRDLLPAGKAVFLTGILADKDYPAILAEVIPFASEFLCLTPRSDRALPGKELADYLMGKGVPARSFADIPAGIAAALEAAGPDGAVVAFGSLYLAGALRSAFPDVMKVRLRSEKIAARDRITPMERGFLSDRIVRHLRKTPEFQRAKTVMIYRAVRGEVRLQALESDPGDKRLVYPLCVNETDMEARLPLEPDAWIPGSFGIPEPDPARSRPVDPSEIDLVICPCVSFDAAGHRLGMGGGYYDRFLPRCENAVTAGVAFEVQRSDQVPVRSRDVSMDLLITENGIQTG